MGYCISNQVDTGAKVVAKVQPTDSVSAICKVGSQFKKIEYRVIFHEIASLRDDATGRLVFNAGNICECFSRVDFPRTIKDDKKLRYILACQEIPHSSLDISECVEPSQQIGVKIEELIFDAFEFTDKFAAWEVERDNECSSLKNSVGSGKDNPITARKAS